MNNRRHSKRPKQKAARSHHTKFADHCAANGYGWGHGPDVIEEIKAKTWLWENGLSVPHPAPQCFLRDRRPRREIIEAHYESAALAAADEESASAAARRSLKIRSQT